MKQKKLTPLDLFEDELAKISSANSEDTGDFLNALHDITKIKGGVSALAKKTPRI